MPIPIPSPQKPIQLYLWAKCGFCTKQKTTLASMEHGAQMWLRSNVNVVTVAEPRDFPMIKGYPFWVVNGKPDPGYKNEDQVLAVMRGVN